MKIITKNMIDACVRELFFYFFETFLAKRLRMSKK